MSGNRITVYQSDAPITSLPRGVDIAWRSILDFDLMGKAAKQVRLGTKLTSALEISKGQGYMKVSNESHPAIYFAFQ